MSSWPVILAAIATDLVPADLALNERALMRAWCDDGDERITLAMAKDDRKVVGDEGFEFLVHGMLLGGLLLFQTGKSLVESLPEGGPFGGINEDRAFVLNVVLLQPQKLASGFVLNGDDGDLFVKNGFTFWHDGPLGWTGDDVHAAMKGWSLARAACPVR